MNIIFLTTVVFLNFSLVLGLIFLALKFTKRLFKQGENLKEYKEIHYARVSYYVYNSNKTDVVSKTLIADSKARRIDFFNSSVNENIKTDNTYIYIPEDGYYNIHYVLNLFVEVQTASYVIIGLSLNDYIINKGDINDETKMDLLDLNITNHVPISIDGTVTSRYHIRPYPKTVIKKLKKGDTISIVYEGESDIVSLLLYSAYVDITKLK